MLWGWLIVGHSCCFKNLDYVFATFALAISKNDLLFGKDVLVVPPQSKVIFNFLISTKYLFHTNIQATHKNIKPTADSILLYRPTQFQMQMVCLLHYVKKILLLL